MRSYPSGFALADLRSVALPLRGRRRALRRCQRAGQSSTDAVERDAEHDPERERESADEAREVYFVSRVVGAFDRIDVGPDLVCRADRVACREQVLSGPLVERCQVGVALVDFLAGTGDRRVKLADRSIEMGASADLLRLNRLGFLFARAYRGVGERFGDFGCLGGQAAGTFIHVSG